MYEFLEFERSENPSTAVTWLWDQSSVGAGYRSLRLLQSFYSKSAGVVSVSRRMLGKEEGLGHDKAMPPPTSSVLFNTLLYVLPK